MNFKRFPTFVTELKNLTVMINLSLTAHGSRLTAILILFLAGFGPTYAQSLIEILPGFPTSAFTSQQLSRWNLLQNENPNDTLYVMNPIDFTRMDSLGRFKIALPGGCPTVFCQATKRVSYPNGDYVVLANVMENDDPDGACSTGDLSVVRHNGTAVGMIRVDDRAFEIRDLKDGKWCLSTAERDTSQMRCVSSGGGGTLHDEHDDEQVETRNNFCVIQVLILFDARSNALNDIEQWARMDIQKTNEALRNSDIFTENLRYEIRDIVQFDLPNPDVGNPMGDLARIRDANQALRNNLGADIVVYYTANDYAAFIPNFGFADITGAALGLEEPFRPVIPERDAYVLVESTRESRELLTFQHEVAHLLQCRHEEQNDPNGEFQHGHRFWYRSGLFGLGRSPGITIMHNVTSRRDRLINLYSNPGIEYRGAATGVAGIRDNARQIRNVGCNVANWRTGTEFSVFIEGPSINCPYQFTYLKANVLGNATNPYSYVWEISTASFQGPFTTIGGNSPILEFWLGDHGQTVYIRLTVSTANGLTTTVFYEVRPTYEANCFPFLQGGNNRSNSETAVSMHVWPNPARERINTALKVESPQEYMYADLLSSDGVILQSQQWKDVQAGTIYTWFQSATLPPGIYRLRIVTPGGVVSNPVVKH